MTFRSRRTMSGSVLPARPARPAPGQIDLWILDAAPAQAEFARRIVENIPVLDDSARRRADRFVHPRLRDGHLVAQVALRLAISRYLGTDPGQPVLTRAACPTCRRDHGRSLIAGSGADSLQFSVAHAAGLAVCAIAASPVGLQMADQHTVSWHAVDGLLHPAEKVLVERVPADRRPLAALTCWVRKDAYLRGSDIGLDVDPAAVYVGLGPAFAEGASARALTPAGWGLLPVSIPGVLAAAALALPDGVSRPLLHARYTDLGKLLPQ
jgi:4'-phosphopantetheinyl transferase